MPVHSLLNAYRQRSWTQRGLLVWVGVGITFLAILLSGLWADATARHYPVTGSVVDNHGFVPIGATAYFHPIRKRLCYYSPSGVVGADGKFAVRTLGFLEGASAGEYRVTLQWRPKAINENGLARGESILPARYASVRSTPLSAVVLPGDNELPRFVVDCCCRDFASLSSQR